METSELRLGNNVFFDINGIKRKITIAEIHTYSVAEVGGVQETDNPKCQIVYKMISKDNLEPIPLTEEVLSILGLEKREEDFIISDIRNAVLNKITVRNGHFYLYLSDYGLDFPVTYLHELQNLYFALIGDELT